MNVPLIKQPVTPTTSTGPLSAIINYDDELKKEQELLAQRQASQQRIMRTNAVGDALKLIIDSVAGSKGATITPRGPNPFLMKAYDAYNAYGDQYENVRRNLAGRKNERAYQQAMTEDQRRYSEQVTRDNRRYNEFDQAKRRKQELEDSALQFEREKEWYEKKRADSLEDQQQLEKLRTNENIREFSVKQRLEQEALNKQAYRSDRTLRYAKDDVLFQIPGTTQKIWLGSDELAEMAHSLIRQKKENGEFITDDVLHAIDNNEQVKPTSLIEIIKQNWDDVKYTLPEYAQQKPQAPSPLQIKQEQYMNERNLIQENTSLTQKQRNKKMDELGRKYKDIFDDKGQMKKEEGLSLKPTHEQELQSLYDSSLTPEQKRSAIYKYLVRNGYDQEHAKNFAEIVYSQFKN